MTIENVANVCIAVYGAFMAAGGVAAFAKTNSKPSLVSGVISGELAPTHRFFILNVLRVVMTQSIAMNIRL